MSNEKLSLEEINQRQTDRYINSLFSMWNSLIVLNGLIIGTISILYLININTNKFIVLTIFLLSSVAILFFIWNYHKIRLLYTDLANISYDKIASMNDAEYKEELEKGKKQSVQGRGWIMRREKIAVFLTFLNLALFLVTIAFN